jgi:hypothetical protein
MAKTDGFEAWVILAGMVGSLVFSLAAARQGSHTATLIGPLQGDPQAVVCRARDGAEITIRLVPGQSFQDSCPADYEAALVDFNVQIDVVNGLLPPDTK